MTEIKSIHPYPYDEFQIKAIQAFINGNNTLVTAHTGSGKTAIAEYCMSYLLKQDFDVIFTSPIKALSNEKYDSWKQKVEIFGIDQDDLGILTGDVKVNPDAKMRIMTAEVLHNMIKLKDASMDKVKLVVMDEFHYINDFHRGKVWEDTIMCLPNQVQLVMLSATIANPEKTMKWISSVRKRDTILSSTFNRVVPLVHYLMIPYPVNNQESSLIKVYQNNIFDHKNYKKLDPKQLKGRTHRKGKGLISSVNMLNITIKELKKTQKLPVIFFCMSRQKCQKYASQVGLNLIDFKLRAEMESYCLNLLKKETFKDLKEQPAYLELKSILNKGMAYHHSGMLHNLRELVEKLFQNGYIKLIFATETLAVGVNMPARTTVFTELEKFDGQIKRPLKPSEFLQMAGRAGRRGKDTIGYVVYAPLEAKSRLFSSVEYHRLCQGKVEPIKSKLEIDHHFVLMNFDNPDIIFQCMGFGQNKTLIQQMEAEVNQLQQKDFSIEPEMKEYLEVYHMLNQGNSFGVQLKQNKRKKLQKKLQQLGNQIENLPEKLSLEQKKEKEKQELDQLLEDIYKAKQKYQQDFQMAKQDLIQWGYAQPDGNLTTLGKVSLCFPDGMPLVMGKVVCHDSFEKLNFEEIVIWLSLFGNACRVNQSYSYSEALENISAPMEEILAFTQSLAKDYSFNWDMMWYVNQWFQSNKNFKTIAYEMDSWRQGDFVKAMLRVCNFIDQLKNALSNPEINLENYTTLNKLDQHESKIMNGVVTNASLYINI